MKRICPICKRNANWYVSICKDCSSSVGSACSTDEQAGACVSPRSTEPFDELASWVDWERQIASEQYRAAKKSKSYRIADCHRAYAKAMQKVLTRLQEAIRQFDKTA